LTLNGRVGSSPTAPIQPIIIALPFPHPPRSVKRSYPVGNRFQQLQQLQQQIEAWQALLEKLGGNE